MSVLRKHIDDIFALLQRGGTQNQNIVPVTVKQLENAAKATNGEEPFQLDGQGLYHVSKKDNGSMELAVLRVGVCCQAWHTCTLMILL